MSRSLTPRKANRSSTATSPKFLVQEKYWFDTQPPDIGEHLDWLGEIDEWARKYNSFKQRGFYVDVVEDEGILTPNSVVDEESLRQVIGHVHQIGWQLRLGEHIVAKQQAEMAESIPSATEDRIEQARRRYGSLPGIDADVVDEIIRLRRAGKQGTSLNNDAYRLRLPGPGSNPFATMGKPGYEAETRELLRLAGKSGLLAQAADDAINPSD
ncbi:hypothetical protein GCM10027258_83470 [Amycolatopsis stemonae]